jgi:hypothetical protein
MRSWVAFLVSVGLLTAGIWSLAANLWRWLSLPEETFRAELSFAFAEIGYDLTGNPSTVYSLMTLADLRLRDSYWVALTLLCTGFGVGACEAALSRGERFLLNYVGSALTAMSFGWGFLYLGLQVLPLDTGSGYLQLSPLWLALGAVPLGYFTVSQFRRLGSEVKL